MYFKFMSSYLLILASHYMFTFNNSCIHSFYFKFSNIKFIACLVSYMHPCQQSRPLAAAVASLEGADPIEVSSDLSP
jgi:hypothetical protein